MTKKYDMTIGNDVIAADEYREILDPATGDVVGLAPVATGADLDAAVAAASEAFATWSQTDDDTRRAACHAIADILEANAAELAELVTREQGKPLKGIGSEFEIGGCVGWTRYTAEQQLPVKILQDDENGRIEQHRIPIGVVGSITPWNWPLLIAIWHIVPAVRTGNTVVIKPSPYTPLGTLRLVELISQALPPGVLNVIAGDDKLGAALSEHSGIGKLVFTGSIETGKKVMASSAPTLKRLTLELGGNDPAIVLPDVNPSDVAPAIFWGSFINCGQTCGAIKRLYVHEDIYEDMCTALVDFSKTVIVGNGLSEDTMMGPLQNEAQYKKVNDLIGDARRIGARILTGDEPIDGPGFFIPVTLVADLENGAALVDQEQFGPVLPIIRYSSLEEAVIAANDTEFGLDASVWTADADAGAAIAKQLHAGTVWVNKHADIAPHVPMGGLKCSGMGVEFGAEGLAAYTEIKIISTPPGTGTGPR